jgi:hypothetical protein
LADATPAVLPRALSTRRTQDAQVMPVIGRLISVLEPGSVPGASSSVSIVGVLVLMRLPIT